MRPPAFALSVVAPVAVALAQPMAMPIDVSRLIIGAPAMIAELDLGKLKGELRQLGWSADDTQLYVQTADGDPLSPKLRHYTVPLAGATPKAPLAIDAEPDWAGAYWTFKSDRTAPGAPSLVIDVEQKSEKTKIGTGSGRPGATGAGGDVAVDLQKTTEGQHQDVVRLKLLGETISEFVNERPIPGLMFGWGPRGTGVIAYTNRDGELKLLDQEAHKRTISGAKDAALPAWSNDGTRVAWVQKSGRKKYVLVVASISKG